MRFIHVVNFKEIQDHYFYISNNIWSLFIVGFTSQYILVSVTFARTLNSPLTSLCIILHNEG